MPFELSNIINIFTFDSMNASTSESENNTYKLVKYLTEESNLEENESQYVIGYINIKDTGCYIIMINCERDDGPTGIFCLSRSDKQKQGYINTLVSSNGKHGDSITLRWNPYEKPSLILNRERNKSKILNIFNLNKNKSKNNKTKFEFNVKVLCA